MCSKELVYSFDDFFERLSLSATTLSGFSLGRALLSTFLSDPFIWALFWVAHSYEHFFEHSIEWPPLLSTFLSESLKRALSWALFWADPLFWALFWALKRVDLLKKALFWVRLLSWVLFWALTLTCNLPPNLPPILVSIFPFCLSRQGPPLWKKGQVWPLWPLPDHTKCFLTLKSPTFHTYI